MNDHNSRWKVWASRIDTCNPETLTSHGATCPDTLSTSDLLQVKDDQWITEKCDIR